MFRLLSAFFLVVSAYAVTPSSNYTLQTINTTTESIIVFPVVVSLCVAVAFTLILSAVLCQYYNKKMKATEHDYQTVYNM
jgi:phosphatidylglycerophosphatase A